MEIELRGLIHLIGNEGDRCTGSKLGCGVSRAERRTGGKVVDRELLSCLYDRQTPVVYSKFHFMPPFCHRNVVDCIPLTDVVISEQVEGKAREKVTTQGITE